ncbi:MAG TPA: carbohydrate kinase [Candidatus Dormibacteraeota bacterium]
MEGRGRIVVCGEALMDVVPAGDGTQRVMPGGGPFNTARALARLGAPVSFLGRLSTDDFGRMLTSLLVADGVDLSLASFGPEPTTRAIAEVDRAGRAAYRFVIEGTSAPNLTPEMLPSALPPDIAALHIGTLGLVLEPMASTLAGLVRRDGERLLVMVDPNIRPAVLDGDAAAYRARLGDVIARSAVVKTSDDDLDWLYPDLDVESAMARFLDAGARLIAVTLAQAGAVGAIGTVRVRVGAPKVEVTDTIGAGDVFGAALLAWLHEHGKLKVDLSLGPHDLESALEFACLAASLTCTRAGADPPSRLEVIGDERLRISSSAEDTPGPAA